MLSKKENTKIKTAQELAEEIISMYKLGEEGFYSAEDYNRIISNDNIDYIISLMNITIQKSEIISPDFLRAIRREIRDQKLLSNENWKSRDEFSSLYYFLQYHPNYLFKKSESPDFILKNTKNEEEIGLEITEAIFGHTAALGNVIHKHFGRNKPYEEIIKDPKLESKSINLRKNIRPSPNPKGTFFVQGLGNPEKTHTIILETAIKKSRKVQSYAQYQKQYLLIDATEELGLFDSYDAEKVRNLFTENIKSIQAFDKIFVMAKYYNIFLEYNTKNMETKIYCEEEN